MKRLSEEHPLMRCLHFGRDDWWEPRGYRIDPFSVMGVLNRGTMDANRMVPCRRRGAGTGSSSPLKTEFRLVEHRNAVKALGHRRSQAEGLRNTGHHR